MPRLTRIFKYREAGVIVAVLVVGATFTFIERKFATIEAFGEILTWATEIGLIAVGISFLMISGEFDLSVGAVFAASGMLVNWLLNQGWPFPAAILATLGMASLVGLVNGTITLKAGIPSFIATLGTQFIIRGLLRVFTGGSPVVLEDEVEERISHLMKIFVGDLGYGFKTSIIWFLGIAALMHFILTSTPYGNRVQAVGGAPDTARALGINVARVKMINFIICSFLAGLSGIISAFRVISVPTTAGMGRELEAIAAAVIGGCLLSGGVGTVAGAAIAAFLIAEIYIGLIVVGAPAYWYIGFVGMLLIVVAIINTRVARLARE